MRGSISVTDFAYRLLRNRQFNLSVKRFSRSVIFFFFCHLSCNGFPFCLMTGFGHAILLKALICPTGTGFNQSIQSAILHFIDEKSCMFSVDLKITRWLKDEC